MSISRGFEASYNVVSKALKGRAERQLQERLAQEQAKYGITENQAYTPEQIQGAQAETDAMARRDAQEFGLSAPMKYRAAAAPRATPGQVQAAQSETAAMAQRDAQEFGLGAPMQYRSAARGFLVGDKAFDTRDEAEAAANVLRTRGMADVYRQAGEVDKADELEVRARQRQAADLQLAGLKRSEAQQVGLDQANKELADARANGVELTSDYLRDLANRTGAKFDTLLNQAAAEFGFEEKQGARTVKKLQANLTKAAGGGVDGLNTFLSENFDPDKTDKILPKVVKDKQGNFVVMYGDRVIPSYGAHKSLDYLVGTVQGMIENDPLSALKSIASIRLTEAQIKKAQAEAGAVGLEKKPRAPTIAELNTIAKGMIDSGMEDPDAPGTPLKYTTALAMARAEAAGVPYVSEADRATAAAIAARQEEERKKKEGGGATTTATTTPARGLFTDPQGRTQLLQPFSDLNSWRRRLVQEQNAASEAGGLTGGF
jgi:hypothetical protein